MGHKRHKFRGSFENQAPGLTGPGITEPDYPAHMPDMVNGKPVVISLEHPENNPPGVTIEEFTEEVPRDSFGINVGQQMEDLLKTHVTQQEHNHTTPNQEENKMENNKETVNNETKNQETKMNNESNNTNKETKQEESKMNEETKTQNATNNQEQPKVDPKDNTKKEEPKVDPKNTNQDAPKSEEEDLPDPNKPAERDGYSRSLGRECAGAFTVGASYGAGVIVGMAAGAAIVYGVRKLFGGSGETAQSTTETASNLF